MGSTTYGAANNNRKFPIAPQFVLSVSYNRPVNPISGTNWEGVGVKPDIDVDGEQALEAAELDALGRLSRTAGLSSQRLAEYRWARVGINARLHPVTLDPVRLRPLAGVYGTVELKMSPEGLRFYRADRPKRPQGVVMTAHSRSHESNCSKRSGYVGFRTFVGIYPGWIAAGIAAPVPGR